MIWPPEGRTKLMALFDEHKTYEGVAEGLGVSVQSVNYYARKLKMRPKARKPRRDSGAFDVSEYKPEALISEDDIKALYGDRGYDD